MNTGKSNHFVAVTLFLFLMVYLSSCSRFVTKDMVKTRVNATDNPYQIDIYYGEDEVDEELEDILDDMYENLDMKKGPTDDFSIIGSISQPTSPKNRLSFATPILSENYYQKELLTNSGKMIVLFAIIEQSIQCSSTFGPASAPSLLICPIRNTGVAVSFP